MNNLHRELAPISAAAWAQIEEEATRTIKRHLAARRVVDVEGPKGFDFPAVGTGHLRQIQTPGDGIEAAQTVQERLGRIGDTQEVQARGSDGADAVGEADERDIGTGNPNFQVFGPQIFEGGK